MGAASILPFKLGYLGFECVHEHPDYNPKKYTTVIGDRVPTSTLASEPRAHEGAQRAYLRTPVSQVRCEGD